MIIKRGHDQQDAIRPQSPGFGNLVRCQHKILAQHREGYGGAGGDQEFIFTLKIVAVS